MAKSTKQTEQEQNDHVQGDVGEMLTTELVVPELQVSQPAEPHKLPRYGPCAYDIAKIGLSHECLSVLCPDQRVSRFHRKQLHWANSRMPRNEHWTVSRQLAGWIHRNNMFNESRCSCYHRNNTGGTGKLTAFVQLILSYNNLSGKLGIGIL